MLDKLLIKHEHGTPKAVRAQASEFMKTWTQDSRCSARPWDLNFHNLGLGNGSLHVTPKAQVTKGKLHKLKFITINNFCAKSTVKKVKGKTHIMRENIYLFHV